MTNMRVGERDICWVHVHTSSRQMMQSGPISTVTQLDRWKIDRVEVDIILTHELEQTDVLRVEPPLLPFGSIVGRDAHVSDWSIKLRCLCQ
jgi:hypothetical protein